ncbi:Aclacinomycin methylesterase RdmC [Xanthomonas sacchari]|uniref:alpha/beta fold hydrolase n=1 Tax=Xanthomonas sacchari TaxID=56458 RepID=UPI00225224C7|nr:alpha/beta hydrolase [Xanthomonas sacchari]MCW0389032.1 Aclacinomycin methylesterase RdmC [Xanthomonas sacchari]
MIGDAGAIGTVQRVRVEGLDIAWDSVGDADAEAVLLISGLGTQMIRWTSSFCTGLAARGYRVIRFDNRDAGASTHFSTCAVPDFAELAAALRAGRRPETPYTLAAMASDAIGLLDGLGVARAHIVGRSMGGMIAQMLASDYPQRVLSLTSIMSSTGNPALPQATPEVMALMSAPEPDPAHDLDGYLRARLAFARRLAGSGYPFDAQAHRKLLLQELARCRGTGGTARQMAAVATAGDRRARLATIAAPTLVVHGSDDPLILSACGEDTARAIPCARYLPVPGMGHDLPRGCERMLIEAICAVARG